MNNQATNPKVSVVILNYNGESVIGECLETVFASSHPLYEVIVVDNASTDKSLLIIENEFPQATLIRNQKNLGAPAGRNVGMEHAMRGNPDYVYSLDNDLTMHPDAILELVNLIEHDKTIGCAGSIIYYYGDPRNRVFNAGNYVNWTQNLVTSRAMNTIDKGQIEDLAFVDYVGSGAMLMPMNILKEVGIFDDGFIGYGYEDTDFGVRVNAAGHKVACLRRSRVWHRPFTAIGAYSFKKKYLEGMNAIRFLRIHGTPWAWIKFSFYASAGLVYASIFQGLRGNIGGVIGKARGMFDGLRRREDYAWKLLNPGNESKATGK